MAKDHSHLYKCVGQVVSARRKKLGMSQRELSEESGVDRVFISNIEQGKRKPSFGAIHDISRGLRIKFSRFVKECENCYQQTA